MNVENREVNPKLINHINELKTAINEISVYDLNTYTAIELYYRIANKLNEVINELLRYEIAVSEQIIEQNNCLQYLLNEGLKIEVVDKINSMVADGTMDTIINHNIFNALNNKIDNMERKMVCNIEEFRETDDETYTNIFKKAVASGKTVLLEDKNYEINETLNMKAFTCLKGGNNTIITINTNNVMINLGHSCTLENIRFIVNSDVTDSILSINTEKIAESINENTIYNYCLDKAILNIKLKDLIIIKTLNIYGGSAIKIEATGKGINGWGINIDNIDVQGYLNYVIRIVNDQKYGDGTSGRTSPWINDININNVRMAKAKNGIIVETANTGGATGSLPKNPQLIKITNTSIQYHNDIDYFAIIKNGRDISFTKCMAWDFNKSSHGAYLIYADGVDRINIDDDYGYEVDYINNEKLPTTTKVGSGYGVLEGAFTQYRLPESNVYTFKQLYDLQAGSYWLPMDDSYSTKLGLPSNTFSYGGIIYVLGGRRGSKTIMVVPSNINLGSAKTGKYNKSIFLMQLSMELKTTSAQSLIDFMNTPINRSYWYEFKDVNDSSVLNGDTTSRPTLNSSNKGFLYYDTTLSALIYWSGGKWRYVKDDTEVV